MKVSQCPVTALRKVMHFRLCHKGATFGSQPFFLSSAFKFVGNSFNHLSQILYSTDNEEKNF